MTRPFDHEKLQVYQDAISFASWAHRLLDDGKAKAPIRAQFARASTSIALNIAEGNGRTSVRDRCRFLEIARGSALECAACLDLLVSTGAVLKAQAEPGKEMLLAIVSMLTGLMASLADRIREEEPAYDSCPLAGYAQKQE